LGFALNAWKKRTSGRRIRGSLCERGLVDPEGEIRYTELVKELTEEPNYEAVLEAITI